MCSCTCRYEGCSCTDERRRFRPGPPESSAARSKVSVSPKKIVFLLGESDPDRTIPRLRRHMKEIAYVAPYRYNPVQCPVRFSISGNASKLHQIYDDNNTKVSIQLSQSTLLSPLNFPNTNLGLKYRIFLDKPPQASPGASTNRFCLHVTRDRATYNRSEVQLILGKTLDV
ncbi:hypothetical protein AGLY_013302 [Aphis glycines]|uniref:Uncharacterized protein n=1 Tax=Aphis glycines TaxID=307491 RepID=A0A6G0T5X8_APHGL|nr:hypothetical protein AGLY_013302 [Aphis glycines]